MNQDSKFYQVFRFAAQLTILGLIAFAVIKCSKEASKQQTKPSIHQPIHTA